MQVPMPGELSSNKTYALPLFKCQRRGGLVCKSALLLYQLLILNLSVRQHSR